MKDHVLAVATALALCNHPAAHAATQILGFTFEPLKCTGTSVIPPSTYDCGFTSLTGTFTFDDADADGHVVRSELINLTVRNISAPGPGIVGGQQHVTSFDYAPATGLSFSADDNWRTRVTTGVSFRYDSPGGSTVEAWLPTTSTRIYPVPEPARALLVLTGVAVVLCRRRRAAPTADAS
jgi:hypothetical protein